MNICKQCKLKSCRNCLIASEDREYYNNQKTDFYNLYRAMLLNAIEGNLFLYSFDKIKNNYENHAWNNTYKQDKDYINSDVDDYPFSFVNLCKYCGVDYDAVREGIKAEVDFIKKNKYTKTNIRKVLLTNDVVYKVFGL